MEYYLLIPLGFIGILGGSMIKDYIQVKYARRGKKFIKDD